MAYQLKPFVINLGDLAYLLKQINFKPLFDANGNAVVNWDGVGSVFTANNTEIFGGTVAGDAASLVAIAANGVGFPSATAPIGVRDVSGYHNNLYGTQADWGAVDEIFRRDVPADYTNYVTSPGANYDPNAVGGFNVTDLMPRIISRTITTAGVNLLKDGANHYVEWRAAKYASDSAYAALVDDSGVDISHLVEGAKIVAPVTTVTAVESLVWDPVAYSASNFYRLGINSLVGTLGDGHIYGSSTGGAPVDGGTVYYFDGISYLALTVGGVELKLDAASYVYKSLVDALDILDTNFSRTTAATGALISVPTGYTPIVVGDVDSSLLLAPTVQTNSGYGLLETLGHIDFQNPNSGEFFIGSENPGVSPVNSWFGIFGQFFDHGLDKLGAGGNGKITIALDSSDPLFGVIGPDGRPTTSITVTRATIAGADANGDAAYINHTSPFIDQSQTYGSHEQLTTLLRKWVSTDGGVNFHAGMELLDGTTLADAWERRWPDGSTTMVHDTLPTLNELRAHLMATGRDDLSWEDVTNLRNRDASGHVIAGESGSPLLLDMNPMFTANHLYSSSGFRDANNNGVQDVGETFYVGFKDDNHDGILNGAEKTQVQIVDDAIAVLAANVRPGDTFGMVGGVLSLTLGSDFVAGPTTITAGTVLTGASAMMEFVNFANFSIFALPGDLHDAVGEVLKASVGDHYIAGDGRVNENFGLTAIHHVFHEEHNYQVENLKTWIYAHDANNTPADHAGLHEWQDATAFQDSFGNYMYNETGKTEVSPGVFKANADNIAWNADKMFEGTKLIVEMEYQHAAIDQYARTITPRIQEFVGYSSSVDPTVSLEYAQVAFRFGHSTIRETIDTIDPSGWFKGAVTTYALEAAFLAPQTYAQEGAAAITLGLSRQQMNEVDEFITPALNQGLLGQPLDLAAINLARGRDMGIPTLNDFRAAIGLTQYTSWADFGANMIHPESLVNFIAAFSFGGDVAAAQAAMLDTNFMNNGAGAPTGADGFNHIDSWIGGLAEAHVPGGLLGETFDAVFVAQMQSLMDGDRFYYLYRLFGTQIGEEVNNGQFKDIVERNTGLSHLNGSIFAYADKYYDFTDAAVGAGDAYKDEHSYAAQLLANLGVGMYSDGGASTTNNGTIVTVDSVTYINDIRPELDPTQVHTVEGTPTSGADSHEVIVGTDNRDFIHARGGDDTIYGEGGNDTLFGDGGIDRIYGGDGNDVIDAGEGPDLVDGGAGDDTIYGRGSGSEVGGFDQLVGGGGNDLIIAGEGIDKLSGGAGDDVLFGDGIVFSEMGNTDPFTHGGDGNDYIDGGASGDLLYGDEGDDLVVGSQDQDIVQGNVGDDILRPGNPSQAINGGPDEVVGDDGYTNNGYDLIDFSDYATGAAVTADLINQANPLVAIDGTSPMPAMFQVEGIIGTQNNDTIVGDSVADGTAVFSHGDNWLIGGSGNDTLQGKGGNDLIVGDGVRLDSLIGTYSGTYTMYDAYADANYRNTGTLQNNGLLDFVGFDKHYTDMLSSAIFKDLELGGSIIEELNGVAGTRQGDGGIAGNADTAVFSGSLSDYTAEQFTFTDAHGNVITGYNINDNRDPNAVDANGTLIPTDGTDVVIGVENFQFADGTYTADLLNYAPVISSNGGDAIAAITIDENTTAVTTVAATDVNNQVLTYSIPNGGDGGADRARFTIDSATGVLTFVSAPNFEAPNDSGTNNVYNVVVRVRDSSGAEDTQAIAVTVANVNEAPVITSNGGADVATTILEGATAVTTITASDVDAGPVLTYSLSGGADLSAFTIDSNTGVLSFITAPDFETPNDAGGNNVYDVTVQVSDGTLTDTQAIAVSIYDVVEAGPVNATPTNINWNGVTPGNTLLPATGAVIANLGTVDADAGDVFTYTLETGSSLGFAISPTGVVTRTGSAMANNQTYTLNVRTTDLQGAFFDKSFTIRTNGAGATNFAAFATPDDDIMYGMQGNDTLVGSGGDDTLFGQAGNDTLNGGADNDTLVGGAGNDTVNGEAGNDTIRYTLGDGNDVVNGGADNDTLAITGAIAANTLNVTLNASGVITSFSGGTVTNVESVTADLLAGTDTLAFNSTAGVTVDLDGGTASGFTSIANIENVSGGVGSDTLTGDAGINTLSGGNGNDTLYGAAGNDTLNGGNNNDTLNGGNDNDTLNGDAGVDTLNGDAGNDTLNGGNDNDTLNGGDNDDTLNGNSGVDTLNGDAGNDTLNGGSNNDTLNGGEGDDILAGGVGADTLTGGIGADTFDFNGTTLATLESGLGANRDLITDFVSGIDKLDFSTMDASLGLAGNQAFVFNATAGAAITGRGQLVFHYENEGALNETTVIQGNVNLDLNPDFEVVLTGHVALQATDIIL